ncbi:MAG: lysophospholipid acyltransferase family protein [Campylobacterota bacterium]|nr:lysophospholipid acyltransferase family protein [Campylobacterota bacterium]
MKIFAFLKWLYATATIFTGMTFTILIFYFLPKPKAVKFTSWMIRTFLFLPVELEGSIDDDTQMILVNHESDIDIGIMETITSKDLVWVAKKELFDIPFYGLLLKLPNDIAVERESKTSLLKLIKDCKDRLKDNRVITIFPEGTRSSKKRMLPFKNGAKIVADKFSLKVQPVVLINTSSYYNIKKFHYSPGTIKAICLDSFYADKSDKEWLNNSRVEMQKVYDIELSNINSYR